MTPIGARKNSIVMLMARFPKRGVVYRWTDDYNVPGNQRAVALAGLVASARDRTRVDTIQLAMKMPTTAKPKFGPDLISFRDSAFIIHQKGSS
jgi:hypothetical protein